MSKKKKDHALSFTATLKDFLLIRLLQASGKISTISELKPDEVAEAESIIQRILFLIQSKKITSIDMDAGTIKIKVAEELDKKEEGLTPAELDRLFANKVIKYILNGIAEELFIGKEAIKNSGKFKRSGHLADQMLKYNLPSKNNPQLSIFDSLQDATRKDIAEAQVEIKEVVEGIRLSPSETKVIDCLCKLLHETSQNLNPKKSNYYAGNIGSELVQFGEEKEETPAPKLAFTLYELTKEYKGGEAVSGKDVDNIKQILTELDAKRFLLSYVETTKIKGGGRIERKIEDFKKLIHIVKISETEYSKEDIELSKTEETVIVLNPIFRRQIDSKFILYPNDINKRTFIAYGSHNISEIALRLRDYLMREHSSKRYSPEITLNKLYHLLAEKWMRESRKKKVKEYTDKALETVIALGLLLSYEIKTGSTGEPKVIFKINKDWE